MALQQRSDEYVVDAPQADAPRSVFLAERAFTGRRGGLIEQPALVVADGKILWVGPEAELPDRYRQDDFFQHHYRGATLLPGMVETHAHLGGFAYNYQPDVPDPARHDAAWHSLTSLTTARQLASLGVTTVMSLGARNFADVTLREAIDSGLLAGPHIVASGAQLTTSGGHSWETGGEVNSPTQIVEKIRDHHKAGVDVIKVMATGGFGTFGSAPWKAQFTTDDLRVLVREAHRLGKVTAAHAHGTEGIRRAAEAGIDMVAHASFIDADGSTRFDPQVADMLAANGTYVDTCSPPSHPAVTGETATPRAKELYDRGVKLVVGNDIGAVVPPSAYTFALKQLEASGLPREEILIAATSRGAAAAGLAGVTGVLEAGYRADIVVAGGNPLEDLSAVDRLEDVFISGRRFQRDFVPQFIPELFSSGDPGLSPRRDVLDARTAWVERNAAAARHPHD